MLLFLLSPNRNFGQENMSKNVLMKAIHNRNNYSDLTAQVTYNIKSFGDKENKEMEYLVNQLKDDSFYLEISRKPKGKSKSIIYEYGDSSFFLVFDSTSQSFEIYGVRVKNNKRNSHVMSRVFGRYNDSTIINKMFKPIKDTIIFNIPCWEYILKPYTNPVSNVIASSIYVSRKDYLFRGFKEIEIFEGIDTVVTSSFIKCIYFNPNEIRENIIIVENEIARIKNNYSQKPTISYENNIKDYTGKVNKVNSFSIFKMDSALLNFSKGKFVVDFWFIGCFPCMKSFPYLDSLAIKYESNGIRFLKINPIDVDEKEKVKRYAKLHSMEKENYLIPRSLCSNFSVDAYPSFIFIEDGKIIKKYTGFDESVYNDLKLFLESWTKNSN